MKRSLRLFSSSLLFGLALDSLHAQTAVDTVVHVVNEVRVVSTSGILAAKTADGKTVTISMANVPAGETPIVARQGPGSTLATGAASSAAIAIASAGSFMMGPNTQVRLPQEEENGHSLELLKGELFLNISAEDLKKSGNSTFRLKTPAALLAVKGTRFFAVSESGSDVAGVHEGSVDVSEPKSNQTVALQAGKAVPIKIGQMGQERPMTQKEQALQRQYAILETKIVETKIGYTNSLGMKFVFVPGTQVLMCIHETRYRDYAAYAGSVLGIDVSWKTEETGITEGAEHPVINVSWEDATAFCAWLSQKEGKTYRLPTDQEWSYAVGIGSKEKRTKDTTPSMLVGKVPDEYPWGGSYPPETADRAGNYWASEGYTDGFESTAPVMSFKPNQLGLYDLGGNVWEWCEDWSDTTQKYRVMRGGSWFSNDRDYLLSSYRNGTEPGFRGNHHGFRVVVVLGSASKSAAP